MFNTYENFNTPCVGTLQKSHKCSKFARFHKGSATAVRVFSEKPMIKDGGSAITVLQVMVFGDHEMLIEYVLNDDLIEGTTLKTTTL